MPLIESVLVGIYGNGATALIKTCIKTYFGENPNMLFQKVFDAADRALEAFFDKYGNKFGTPNDSFFAKEENWYAIFNVLKFNNPSLPEARIDPNGLHEALPATADAVEFFLSTLNQQMTMDRDLDAILEQKKSISEGNEIHNTIQRIDTKLNELTSPNKKKRSFQKILNNKMPRMSRNMIVGRKSDLDKLHSNLFDKKQVVLVNGIGGIGKTTLAQVYVDKYKKEYHHIAWIPQLFNDVEGNFINTEGLLHHLSIKSKGRSIHDLFAEVISAFNNINNSPNLLIIDDAYKSLKNYRDYFQGCPDWHVLITSRERIENFDLQEIGFLTEHEAVELFLKHYTRGILSREEIVSLVTVVELHTLSIEILAKTAQLQQLVITEMKAVIVDNLKANLPALHNEDTIVERITSHLCSVFTLSKLSDDEIWLLKQFACLPAEFHGYKLLKSLIDPKKYNKERIFSETIKSLSSKGWILKGNDGGSYRMHGIVADVLFRQSMITVEEVHSLIKNITRLLYIDQKKDNPADTFRWIPFGESINTVFIKSDHTGISELLNNLAAVFRYYGDYTKAKTLLEKTAKIFEKNFGPDHPETVKCYSNLATVFRELGDYTKAKELFENVVKSTELIFGADHIETARSYSNLAMVLIRTGDYTKAKDLLEKAVISDQKHLGPEHPTTVKRYSNLALVLRELGDFTEAKGLLEKAVESNEKHLGPEHPETAVSYSNLALVYINLGDYTSAKALLEKAATSNEKNFGPEHPETATNYSNLVSVFRGLGDYTEAKKLLEAVVSLDEKNFGPEHPDTAVSYSNLALVLKDLGDNTGAKTLLEKAMKSNEMNFGSEHPTTARSYSNCATVLQTLGDYTGAKTLLEKAIKSNEMNFGPEHPTTTRCYSNLATMLQTLGDYTGAKTLLEKVVKSDEMNFGPEHPTTAMSYSNLAIVLQALGDYTGAKTLLEKAMISDEMNFGPEHSTTAVSYSNLATVYQDLGDYAGAKTLLENAVKSNEMNFGPEHPTTAVSYSLLGTVLKDLGDYAGAKTLLEKAMKSNEMNFGFEHPTTAVSYSFLAIVLKDLGDYENALKLSAYSIIIYKKVLPEDHPDIKMATGIYQSIKKCMS